MCLKIYISGVLHFPFVNVNVALMICSVRLFFILIGGEKDIGFDCGQINECLADFLESFYVFTGSISDAALLLFMQFMFLLFDTILIFFFFVIPTFSSLCVLCFLLGCTSSLVMFLHTCFVYWTYVHCVSSLFSSHSFFVSNDEHYKKRRKKHV